MKAYGQKHKIISKNNLNPSLYDENSHLQTVPVSGRNAVYLQREVHGVIVDDAIAARYEGADRERGEALALEISADFARRMRPSVDGYYLMTPFGRTGLVCRIMDAIRKG